jgi:hypothetical protein
MPKKGVDASVMKKELVMERREQTNLNVHAKRLDAITCCRRRRS